MQRPSAGGRREVTIGDQEQARQLTDERERQETRLFACLRVKIAIAMARKKVREWQGTLGQRKKKKKKGKEV